MKFPYRLIVQKYLSSKEEKSFLIKYIKSRLLKQDGHIILIITGATGSGKSEAGLVICQEVDPYFNEDRFCFNVQQYAKKMSKFYPRGSAFLFEEAQHSASNLNYFSASNKALFSLLSTFRHRNYLTVVTLPYEFDFDKKSKRLRHIDVKMQGVPDSKRGLSKAKVYLPKQSEYKDKTYLNPMKASDKNGRFEIKGCYFKRPSRQLRNDYLRKKYEFTSNLSQTVLLTLEESNAKKIKEMSKGK